MFDILKTMLKVGDRGEVLTVDRQELARLIDKEARQLGLSGPQALDMIENGKAGDNYLWSDISFLADLLSHAR